MENQISWNIGKLHGTTKIKVSKRENCDRYYLFQGFGFGIFIHKLHTDETPDVFHTHPWNAISFILGSYKEQKINGGSVKKSFFNFVRAKTPHRIEVGDKPVWTLFFHGRKCNKWGVFNKNCDQIDSEPWDGMENPDRKSFVPVYEN